MLFKGEICPVCKRQFEEGDDIVHCPECGTPHHRECYSLTGHCVNRSLHKTGYDYYKEHKPVNEDVKTEANEGKPEFPFGVFPPIINSGNAQQNNISDITETPYDKDSDTIDGESTGDVAAFVRSNVQRFIAVFKRQEQTGKKAGWNWGAFIFGAYYLFFRKMYRQAITLFCVNLTLSSLATLLCTKFAPLTYAAFGELQKLMVNNDTSAIYDKALAIQGLSDFKIFYAINIGIIAAIAIIRVLVAVFADSMYKSHTTSYIKRINEQLDSGASFSAPMLTPQEEETLNLGQQQMKRIYLLKRGGTSLWAPFAAYAVLYIISYITGA